LVVVLVVMVIATASLVDLVVEEEVTVEKKHLELLNKEMMVEIHIVTEAAEAAALVLLVLMLEKVEVVMVVLERHIQSQDLP
tara:strand:+ start:804 stop:1049 length:246 start_codon:yes stop_codon:yes gene_type:complete